MDVSYFDHRHYDKVLAARRDQGLRHVPHSRPSIDTSLLHRTVVDSTTGKSYTVDKVAEHWCLGWYRIITMFDSNGSHAVCWVENISSHDDAVIKSVQEFKEEYKIIF